MHFLYICAHSKNVNVLSPFLLIYQASWVQSPQTASHCVQILCKIRLRVAFIFFSCATLITMGRAGIQSIDMHHIWTHNRWTAPLELESKGRGLRWRWNAMRTIAPQVTASDVFCREIGKCKKQDRSFTSKKKARKWIVHKMRKNKETQT